MNLLYFPCLSATNLEGSTIPKTITFPQTVLQSEQLLLLTTMLCSVTIVWNLLLFMKNECVKIRREKHLFNKNKNLQHSSGNMPRVSAL